MIVPDEGGSHPAIICKRVDFPDPLLPINATFVLYLQIDRGL